MRRIFTSEQTDLTRSTLRWGEKVGKWQRLGRGVYLEGSEPPDPIDIARARVLAEHTAARGTLAGVLHGLDSVTLDNRPTRRATPPSMRIQTIGNVPCADGLTALIDLAALLDDRRWEHALESALRTRLVSVAQLEEILAAVSQARNSGAQRIRRVLALRPAGAPATESLLETLTVQLVRDIPGLPPPLRQFTVYDEVVHVPRATARRLAGLVEQARRRPLPQSA